MRRAYIARETYGHRPRSRESVMAEFRCVYELHAKDFAGYDWHGQMGKILCTRAQECII